MAGPRQTFRPWLTIGMAGSRPDALTPVARALAPNSVGLPKRTEAEVIGKQALRSGTSVGEYFREAHRARSDAEFLSKVGDCLKELEATSYWLDLLVEGEIVPANRLGSLQDECNQLTAILATICKKVKSHTK
jgi:four helix bundle protein